jgi:hypothetical protein
MTKYKYNWLRLCCIYNPEPPTLDELTWEKSKESKKKVGQTQVRLPSGEREGSCCFVRYF